jgi:L-alanine-DL-glutamate epimerase-like enolase superfamily enzyme
MRITDVKVEPVELPPQLSFRTGDRHHSDAGRQPRTGAVLRIVTEDGLEGAAHSRRGQVLMDVVEQRIADELVGEDALARERLWERMWEIDRVEKFPVHVLGLVDVALWDLAGKAAGMPVHRLLGGYREEIEAYASLAAFGSVEEHLDVIDQCLELGFGAVKLRGWGDPHRDAELCLAARAHVGGRAVLMYDASGAFDLPDAVYVGQALTEANYLWYAEPMREFSVVSYRWLADRVGVPLLVAESAEGPNLNIADFIISGCAEYVHTGELYRGGITGAMRVAHLADAFLLRAEVRGSGLVAAHLCMSISNATYYESPVLTNPVVRDHMVDARGVLHAPQAPGIGYDTLPAPFTP